MEYIIKECYSTWQYLSILNYTWLDLRGIDTLSGVANVQIVWPKKGSILEGKTLPLAGANSFLLE